MERNPNYNAPLQSAMDNCCSPSERGPPAWDRDHDGNATKGTEQRRRANSIVHCDKPESCGKGEAYMEKYHPKK